MFVLRIPLRLRDLKRSLSFTDILAEIIPFKKYIYNLFLNGEEQELMYVYYRKIHLEFLRKIIPATVRQRT